MNSLEARAPVTAIFEIVAEVLFGLAGIAALRSRARVQQNKYDYGDTTTKRQQNAEACRRLNHAPV